MSGILVGLVIGAGLGFIWVAAAWVFDQMAQQRALERVRQKYPELFEDRSR